MENIESLDEARELIESNPMTLLYLSRPDCGVCTALKPKVEKMLQEYPGVRAGYVDLDALPEAAGEFSIFTIPGILVFVNGKESVREARYVSMDELESKIARPYQFLFPSSR
jgi:thioredoxin-like negative regulator of GroEL